jgi:hypothetical protein
MGRYDSHKHPFTYKLNQWSRNRTNNESESKPKSMPCHVVKVEKDFIHIAFETANGIFTPPVVKIPQAMSQYGREPTQVGDKGHAVPGSYYLGGVTGDAGGNTDFYPRSNLTPLSFNGVSHTQNPGRDYDQLTHMGGPTGWITRAFEQQQQDQGSQGSQGGQGGQGGQSPAVASANFVRNIPRTRMMNIQRRMHGIPQVAPQAAGNGGGSSGGSGQSSQSQNNGPTGTNFNFDKNNLCTMQSKDSDHNITVDSQSKKVTLNLPVGEWGYAGGDGQKGKYARIMTESGPSVNFKARIG